MIPLILCECGALSQPLLYLSLYFEKNYDNYIDLMFEVSRSGHWEDWIEFFLVGVEESSRGAITKATALLDLHQRYMHQTQTARSSALLGKIIDSLFEVPVLTIPHVMQELGISYNAAKNNVKKLLELNMLTPADVPGNVKWFYAHEIGAIAAAPTS